MDKARDPWDAASSENHRWNFVTFGGVSVFVPQFSVIVPGTCECPLFWGRKMSNIHPLNIVKVQYPDTGDQRPRQARPLGGSRGSAVPPLGWGMCTPRKKGKVVIRQLLKGKKKTHLQFPQSQKNNMSFFRKDDGWFSDYTTGDYRAHTCLRYQYCCHVVLALECFALTCIRLWFRMTFHVSFPISWNGFMVIWFGNDFFMPPGTGQRDSRHTWLAQKHGGPMEMWWFIMRVGTRIKIYTYRIHGTGIFTYIWVMFMIDVGYIYHT